jgi:hypothetical protein
MVCGLSGALNVFARKTESGRYFSTFQAFERSGADAGTLSPPLRCFRRIRLFL